MDGIVFSPRYQALGYAQPKIIPVPKCCGAAIALDFGSESGGIVSAEDGATLSAAIAKIGKDFDDRAGEFKPYGYFPDRNYDESSAYWSRNRSYVQVFLNQHQMVRDRADFEAAGFREVDKFFNRKSGLWVYVFSKGHTGYAGDEDDDD